MSNYPPSTRQRISDINLGLKVTREVAGIVFVPTTNPIFNIIGGRIVLHELVGEAMDTMEAVGTTLIIVANPTAGSGASADVNLTTGASGSISGLLAGTKWSLPASPGSVLTVSGDGAGALMLSNNPTWLLNVGTIDLVCGTSANTGTIKWTAVYVPFDVGAYMTAAA